MDSPNKLQKYKSTKSTKKYVSTKVLITQPFFELQTPDFAWKFIWTVEPNYKVQKYKKYKTTKVKNYKSKKVQKSKNSRFCIEVCMDSLNKLLNYKSTESPQVQELSWKLIMAVKPNDKVQKYKKYKNTKNAKNANMQKTAKT